MIHRWLPSTRYLILIAVAGSLIAATALLIYGGVEIVEVVAQTIASGRVSSKGAKVLALTLIELVDLFLLGTAFYIIALGLYELFIDDTIPLPDWLQIHNLDDLKGKLISVLVVVMAVAFLGQVANWDGQRDLMGYGVAVSLVIAALTYFLSQKIKKDKPAQDENG
jgi:uncharacterized membrane protein YqhA